MILMAVKSFSDRTVSAAHTIDNLILGAYYEKCGRASFCHSSDCYEPCSQNRKDIDECLI